MILVIADDISGAAELAAVARRHGLSAEVQTQFDPSTDAQMIALDTATRSLSAHEAAARISEFANQAATCGAALIYKKVDSVLRGHIVTETRVLMKALGKRRTLLVAANPGRGRTIRGGRYYINSQPLDQTPLGRDPEMRAPTADVRTLLGCEAADDAMIAPDVEDADALKRLAESAGDEMLLAGASEFFAALLRQRGLTAADRGRSAPPLDSGLMLFVCGSLVAWSSGRGEECARHGVHVAAMPGDQFADAAADTSLREWANAASAALGRTNAVMMAIGAPAAPAVPMSIRTASTLADRLSQAVQIVLHQTPIAHLLVEGGATATALLRRMSWSRLRVDQTLDEGLAAMQPMTPPHLNLFIKPGSYRWPPSVWSLKPASP